MALEWQPEYPDLIPAVRRRAGWWIGSAAGPSPEPIPIPPPPTDTVWIPTFPDLLFRRRLSVAAFPFVAAPVFTPVVLVPMQWQPTAPDYLRRKRRPASPSNGDLPFSVFPAIAAQMAWQPEAPDYLRPRRRLNAGSSLWQIDMGILIDLQPCLTWEDGDLISPTLAIEGVTQAGFGSEALIAPIFSSEGLC